MTREQAIKLLTRETSRSEIKRLKYEEGLAHEEVTEKNIMKMYEENKEDFHAYLEEMCAKLKRIWEQFVENYNILVEDLNSLEWNIFGQEEWQDD